MFPKEANIKFIKKSTQFESDPGEEENAPTFRNPTPCSGQIHSASISTSLEHSEQRIQLKV